jgi:YVTN family beta-propeller protein
VDIDWRNNVKNIVRLSKNETSRNYLARKVFWDVATRDRQGHEMRKSLLILEVFPLLIALWCLSGCGGSTSSNSQSQPTPARVVATVPVGVFPTALDVNSVTNRIYVVNYGDQPSSVSVIDGNTNSVVATVPVGMAPYAIAVNSSTNKIYVSNSGEQSVTVSMGPRTTPQP